MNPIVPLLAAIDGELIKVIVIFIIVGLSALGKLMQKWQDVQRRGGAAQMPQAPKPAPDNPVANEIEEFLKRSQRPRGDGGLRPLPAQPKPAESPVMATATARKPRNAVAGAERPVGGRVGEHVKKYLDEKDFSRRSAQLGAEVAHVDSDINQHLHQTFDHALSKLASVPGEAAVPPTAIESTELAEIIPDISAMSPAGLFILLGDPDSIRQAIVLNEILHRPEERWA